MRVIQITDDPHGPHVETIFPDLIAAVEVRFVNADYQVWAYPIMGEPFRVKGGFGGEHVFSGIGPDGFSRNERAHSRAEAWARKLCVEIGGSGSQFSGSV